MDGMRAIAWLHVWQGASEVMCSEINKQDLAYLKQFYGDRANLTYFTGKTATIVTLSDYSYITRGDCLKMATAFVQGNYVTHYVDLEKSTVTRKKGVPLSGNPR